MRIIQTRSNGFDLEYDNGQLAFPGAAFTGNNGKPVTFRRVVDGYVELSEPDDPLDNEPPTRIAAGEFLDTFTSDAERVDRGRDLKGPATERHHRRVSVRWAKESIALVAVELNEAYAYFEIRDDGYETPTGLICTAHQRLEEAMRRLDINTEIDPLPF